MTHVRSFPPLAKKDARVLILGSMPGLASLEANEYYAHQRNAFWRIMSGVYAFDPAMPYEARCAELTRNQVAVWDVLEACYRPGSLDAAIEESSIVANDFAPFLKAHAAIRRILFNGAKAEIAYSRFVMPNLPEALSAIPAVRLPSTSPAHAAMTAEAKLAAWKVHLHE